MPRVRFEPTIPAFERTKTVYALDRAATVIDKVDQIKDDKATWACSTHYIFVKYLVIKLKETRPSGIHIRRWENDIKMYLK
jgi:hypothetical protein